MKFLAYLLTFLFGASAMWWGLYFAPSWQPWPPIKENVALEGSNAPQGVNQVKLTHCSSENGLPDPKCNSPVMNKALTVAQVCDPSFRTGTIRPPTSYTNPLKIQKMKEYGLVADTSLFELDHIQPLTNLGDPKDPENLWPQYWHLNVNGYDAGAKTKDTLEVRVHKLLCSGKMTISEVNVCFGDWLACYRKWIGELPRYKDESTGAVE